MQIKKVILLAMISPFLPLFLIYLVARFDRDEIERVNVLYEKCEKLNGPMTRADVREAMGEEPKLITYEKFVPPYGTDSVVYEKWWYTLPKFGSARSSEIMCRFDSAKGTLNHKSCGE